MGYDLFLRNLDEELKKFLDADPRSKREIGNTAFWREFGGESKAAIDLRIEQRDRRIETIEKEIEELQDELAEEKAERESLIAKREEMKAPEDKLREDINALISRAEAGEVNKIIADNPEVKDIAEGTEKSPADVVEEAKRVAAKNDRRLFNTHFMTPMQERRLHPSEKQLIADAYEGGEE